MTRTILATLVLLIAGCAATPDEGGDDAATKESADVITKSDAIDDFIRVAELEEVPAVRSLMQLYSKVLSDRYILVYDNRKKWIAAYARPCKKLYQSQVDPDIRYERNTLRARFDTFRGCKIDRIYEISDGLAEELETLGKAPGEK